MPATLAVLITYHNEGELLTECLLSLQQGRQIPDEILIYDDASDLPAENYIPANVTARVIRGTENRGPGYGRNHLMAASQCQYIHFHDADDLFHPDWGRQVRLAIEQGEPEIVVTEVASFKNNTLFAERVLGLPPIVQLSDLLLFAIRGVLLVPSTTFHRELGLKIGGYRPWEILPQSEDFDFHIRLVAVATSFTVIYEPLIGQNLRANSHSATNRAKCLTSTISAIELLAQELPLLYHPELAERCLQVASWLYKMQCYNEAQCGFELARTLAKPTYKHFPHLYQWLAQRLGLITVERAAALYRACLPYTLRQNVRSLLK